MIIGISMVQETCLIHGEVSLILLYWKKYLQKDFCGPFVARTLEDNGKECQGEGEAKVVE